MVYGLVRGVFLLAGISLLIHIPAVSPAAEAVARDGVHLLQAVVDWLQRALRQAG